MGSREPRSPDTCIPTVPTAHGHSIICACVNTYSHPIQCLICVHSDDDCIRQWREIAQWRWLEARKGKDNAMYVREKTLRSGERLQWRTQHKRQLRTVESADDRLEEKTTLSLASQSLLGYRGLFPEVRGWGRTYSLFTHTINIFELPFICHLSTYFFCAIDMLSTIGMISTLT